VKTFFKHHTNPTRKKGKLLVKTFFWRSHYTFGNILFEHLADSSCLTPQTVLLSYDYGLERCMMAVSAGTLLQTSN